MDLTAHSIEGIIKGPVRVHPERIHKAMISGIEMVQADGILTVNRAEKRKTANLLA